MRHIVALTGPPGSGKTTVCARLAEAARADGLRVAGLLSPPLTGEGADERRAVVDLASGERRPLASRVDDGAGRRRWALDPDALAWGSLAAREAAAAADVLIIDELGPLELVEGAGWADCVELVRGTRVPLVVVVVRPRLLDRFRVALGVDPAKDLEVIQVTPENREGLPVALLEIA